MKTYQALSALLSYPTEELKRSATAIRTAIKKDRLVPARLLDDLEPLLSDLERLDIYELQERYVFLFDRTRSLSLHLFEHVHGESRDRGQAMVDLKSLYAQSGLEIDARELPDYLPLFLEFLSTQPFEESRALLREPLSVLVVLKERLEKRKTPYASVFQALEYIANTEPEKTELSELRRMPDDDPNDLEALDAAWEDQPVTFGPGDEGCPQVNQMLKRMQVDTEDAGGGNSLGGSS